MQQSLMIQTNETVDEYFLRLCLNKSIYGITWNEIAMLMNTLQNTNYSASKYRKDSKKVLQEYEQECSAVEEKSNEFDTTFMSEYLNEYRKLKMQLSEERTQNNAVLRRLSREETIQNIAHDYAEQMSSKKILEPPLPVDDYMNLRPDMYSEAILQLSDWHYGIEIDSAWNFYNSDVCVLRLNKLKQEVIRDCLLHNVTVLHVVNLGDLISGRIHSIIRLQNREDCITQIMDVSEILAEFLNELSAHVDIEYYACLDNHSRVEPNKIESLEHESLTRITTWYLKERLKDNNAIHINTQNEWSDNIITFSVYGWNIAGVHGHQDNESKLISNITMMTHDTYDLVLSAHKHHFSCDEQNMCTRVSNSSLMGTDSYSEELRLSAVPSQNLIIVTDENPVHCIYRIRLD